MKSTQGSVGMYIIIVLVIALAAGLLLFGNNKSSDEAMNEEGLEMTEEMSEDTTMMNAELTDGTYMVEASESSLTWTGRKKVGGSSHSAVIPVSEGQIMVKDGLVDASEFTFAVSELALVEGDTGGDNFMGHVTGEDFLAVEEFPTASLMISEGMVSAAGDTMLAKAELTIKGETNQIDIPFMVSADEDGHMMVTGTVEIDRTEWGIRFGSDRFFDNLGDAVIDDMVTVSFNVVAAMGSHDHMEQDKDDAEMDKTEEETEE